MIQKKNIHPEAAIEQSSQLQKDARSLGLNEMEHQGFQSADGKRE